jgi:hypothetical protein
MNVLASLSFRGEALAVDAHIADCARHKKQHDRNGSSHVLIPSMSFNDYQ